MKNLPYKSATIILGTITFALIVLPRFAYL